jgi:hypothetical protein
MYRKPSPKRLAASARKLEALRRGRDRANANKPPRLYPPTLPDVRRVVTVTDYDAAQPVTHTLELRRTKRVDVYEVLADGKPWKRCGWSGALEGLRKSFPRIPSPRSDVWRE